MWCCDHPSTLFPIAVTHKIIYTHLFSNHKEFHNINNSDERVKPIGTSSIMDMYYTGVFECDG